MLLRQCLAWAVLLAGLLITAPASAQNRPNNQQQNQSPVQQASKTLNDARADLKKAQAEVQKARDKVKLELLAKPEWAPVVQELAKAQTDAATAKRNALNAAHSKPEYQAAMKTRDDADKVRQQASAPAGGSDDTKVSEAELASASNNYITAAMTMKKIEKQALADDQSLADAEARLEAAKAKMAQLDAEIDESLKNDQTYISLQQAVATAQQAVDSADEQLKQARLQVQQQRQSQSQQRSPSSGSGGLR